MYSYAGGASAPVSGDTTRSAAMCDDFACGHSPRSDAASVSARSAFDSPQKLCETVLGGFKVDVELI